MKNQFHNIFFCFLNFIFVYLSYFQRKVIDQIGII